jgi:hypothetical protein
VDVVAEEKYVDASRSSKNRQQSYNGGHGDMLNQFEKLIKKDDNPRVDKEKTE